MMQKSRWVWLLAVLAVFSITAAACSDDEESGSDDGTEDTEDGGSEGGGGEGASGDIVVSGSSTVEPISSLVAEAFSGENADVGISVDGPGTGDGFTLFCSGETDISDASRPIKEEEAAACEEAGIEFIELKVGIDGLSVITNPANEAVECLDNAAIYALVGPESTGFANWSDAADLATELDSVVTEFPDASLDITAPGEESGTYDSFVELTIEGIAEERGQDPATRPDYTASPNDNVIVEGIEGSESSFGWVGFAFYAAEGEALRAIPIAGEDGTCVEPTPESIAAGEYPLARDLFIYVNAAKAEENDALASFVDFYMSDAGFDAVADAGYVQLTEDAWAETTAAWEARQTGTTAG
jgi:phosphate transport system substrate-binding protein